MYIISRKLSCNGQQRKLVFSLSTKSVQIFMLKMQIRLATGPGWGAYVLPRPPSCNGEGLMYSLDPLAATGKEGRAYVLSRPPSCNGEGGKGLCTP